MRWCARLIAITLLGIALNPQGLHGQASAYVPLDDISYRYVDALMARGWFRELSALERPFTVRALAAAVDSAREREPGSTVRSYLDALYSTIQKYAVRPGNYDTAAAQTFRARFSGNLYLTGQTSGRRELMLADESNAVRPGGSIRLVLGAGPVVGYVRSLIDSRLNVDPEFSGRKDRTLAGRTEDGYVSGQWKYGELSFGRTARNWGPPTLQGLELGDYAYTYDHVYGLVGTDKLHFSTVVARLDNMTLQSGQVDQRYFSIHRLAVRRASWEIAATESYIYSGPGRGFEPSLVNPFNIYSLSWRDENQEGNLGLGVEVAYRTRRVGTLTAHIFLDDLQIDRCDPNCAEPSSYGLTIAGEGLPLRGDQRWFASYTRVSNLTYRTPNPSETYSMLGVGLGRGFSDYDEIKVGADLAVVPRTPLRLYVARRRQGEGDYRATYPPAVDYATTPGIFSGVVMGVTRVGVAGASRWMDFELSADVGVNRSTNYLHVSGASDTSFEGRLKLSVEPRWSLSF